LIDSETTDPAVRGTQSTDHIDAPNANRLLRGASSAIASNISAEIVAFVSRSSLKSTTLIHSDRLLLAAIPDWTLLLPLPGAPLLVLVSPGSSAGLPTRCRPKSLCSPPPRWFGRSWYRGRCGGARGRRSQELTQLQDCDVGRPAGHCSATARKFHGHWYARQVPMKAVKSWILFRVPKTADATSPPFGAAPPGLTGAGLQL
jgi:hypothetical protein